MDLGSVGLSSSVRSMSALDRESDDDDEDEDDEGEDDVEEDDKEDEKVVIKTEKKEKKEKKAKARTKIDNIKDNARKVAKNCKKYITKRDANKLFDELRNYGRKITIKGVSREERQWVFKESCTLHDYRVWSCENKSKTERYLVFDCKCG